MFMKKLIVRFSWLIIFINISNVFAAIKVEKAINVTHDIQYPFEGLMASASYELNETEPKIIIKVTDDFEEQIFYISFTGVDLLFGMSLFSSPGYALNITFADANFTIESLENGPRYRPYTTKKAASAHNKNGANSK